MSNNTDSVLRPLQQPIVQNSATEMKKILVVDDEPDARVLFQDMLTDGTEYEVSTAADGEEALAKAEATKFDLILLDIIMPNKDGIQTLTEIKNNPDKFGTPRIIMLTNLGGDLAVEEAMKQGANGYKVKVDTEPGDLIKLVEGELG